MKKTLMAIMASAFLAFSMAGTAQAAEGETYSTAGLGSYSIKAKDGLTNKKSVFGGYVGGGYGVSDFVDLELRLGATGKANVSKTATPTNVGMTFALSYLVKPHFEVTDGVNLYGVLGGTTARMKVTSTGFSQSNTKTGFTYGVGANVAIDDNWSAGAEYAVYMKNAKFGNVKTDIAGITANIVYKY